MSRAEERALEAYPYNSAYTSNDVEYDGNFCNRLPYIEGYEQAEKDLAEEQYNLLNKACDARYEQAKKDFIALVKQYLEKGEKCMEQEGESQIYAFWDGFHNCAENILREMEDEK